MEGFENNITYKLLDLNKNLMCFYKKLYVNFVVMEDKILYNFRDIVFDLNTNINVLNNIFCNYDLENMDATLLFLEEKKKKLYGELELKKKKEQKDLVFQFEISLLELEIEHYSIVFCNLLKKKKKEEFKFITLEHVEKFFENCGFDNIYEVVFELLLDDFNFILENYLKTKEYEIFDKNTAFFDLQKEMQKHLIFLTKILKIDKYIIFSERINKEILLLEELLEKKEIEQLFFLFKIKHYKQLFEIFENKEEKKLMLFTSEYIEVFYQNIILLKQKNYMRLQNKTIVLELQQHLQRFSLLIESMFIKENYGYSLPDFNSAHNLILLKINYFIELQNLVKNLPVSCEEELKNFIKEQMKKIEKKILMKDIDNFQYKFLEIELEHFVMMKKAIKTKTLKKTKGLISFEIYWDNLINEQKIVTYLSDFVSILSLLRFVKILQTEEDQLYFLECKVKLLANLNQWETVWKMKGVESFSKTVEKLLLTTTQILDNSNSLDQLFLNVTKKHFNIILKELKKGGEKKEYLSIDFNYIEDFLEEFVIIKSYMLEDK